MRSSEIWLIEDAVDDVDVMKIVEIEEDNDRDAWDDDDSWTNDEIEPDCEILNNLFFWYWMTENNIL